jgi:hypothetical protein
MEVGIGLPASSPDVTAVGATHLVTTFRRRHQHVLQETSFPENGLPDRSFVREFIGGQQEGV